MASTSATAGDRRAPTPSHLRSASAQRHPPRGGAEADHAVRRQARRDRRSRGRRAGDHPVRPGVLEDRGRGVLLADPGRDARRRAGHGGGELPLRRQGEGDAGDARRRDEFETRIVPLVEVDGETVSSTRIRALVAAGDVDAAMRCLGAPFMFEGEVVEGDNAGGRSVPDRESRARRPPGLPGHGVYAAFADGLPAAVNVGVRPTFETGRGLLIESFLIDYDDDLYGQTCASPLSAGCGGRTLPERRGADRTDAPGCGRGPRDPRALRDFQPSTLPYRVNAADEGQKAGAGRQVRPVGRGHRIRRGPGRAAHRANQRAHRAPAHSQQGPPLPPWPAEDGRQAPSHAPLPGASDLERYRSLVAELGLRR